MKLEVRDKNIYLNGKSVSIIGSEIPDAPYHTSFLGNKHEDFKYSECKNYAFFHNSIKEYDFINPDFFMEDLYLDCFDIEYEKKSLLGLYKKNEVLYVSMVFRITYSDWDKDFSLKEFLLNFKKVVQKDKRLFCMDDGFCFIVIPRIEVNESKKLDTIIKDIESLYFSIENTILSSNRLDTSIAFSPVHLSAGSSILQYFGKLLQERYPNEKVSVSIKQEDLKVTMTVETPDGKKEEIEEYLNKYGLVISNQITPQEFTSNPIQILELETKLESAKVEIGFQKKLLALQDKTYDENLVSLKDEVKFLRTELSSIQTNNNEQIKLLLSSLLSKDKLIKKLTKSIDKKDELETKQLLLELKDKDNNGYIGLKQHLDNAMIGGIVNAPSWIQFTMGIITKL